MEPQKTLNTQSNLEKEKTKIKARGVTLPDFKLYCRAIIIKIPWCWQNKKHTDQWNRIKSPEIKLHV